MNERMQAIVEELAEVSSMPELKALWCFGQQERNEYGDAVLVPHLKAAVARLRLCPPVQGAAVEEVVVAPRIVVARTHSTKRYKLLSHDVSWSTKPQVQALMEILKAHVPVGGTLDESTIVEACVANEAVLQTRQGGKRIWDYYKGNHAEGLRMHGNVEVV